jgi:poly(3-hydroxybutyrate) depolymerase
MRFDQSEFIHSPYASMSDTGYVYIPNECETEAAACRVHVALHGCQQGQAVIGARYVSTTGYNELADDNRIVVLYPQVEPRSPIPQNPNGCWDWWGYSDPDPRVPTFHTRDGTQIRAIMAMIERLGAPRER